MSTATATPMETQALGVKSDAAPAAPKAPPVVISEKAAAEVRRIVAEQNLPEKLYLRLRVVGGGCSGFQHKLDLDPQVNEKLDETFVLNGVDVVVDKRSMLYLAGVTVDFHDDLNKRGFSIENPSAKTKCGCGSSFSM
jgi:iron-sulfur cluster assembly protein